MFKWFKGKIIIPALIGAAFSIILLNYVSNIKTGLLLPIYYLFPLLYIVLVVLIIKKSPKSTGLITGCLFACFELLTLIIFVGIQNVLNNQDIYYQIGPIGLFQVMIAYLRIYSEDTAEIQGVVFVLEILRFIVLAIEGVMAGLLGWLLLRKRTTTDNSQILNPIPLPMADYIPIRSSRPSWLKITALSVIIIILYIIGVAYLAKYVADDPLLNLKPIAYEPLKSLDPISTKKELLPDNLKLAFVKDSNLYLMDKTKVDQITSGRGIGKLKWSPDGKLLAWIEKTEFTLTNTNGTRKEFFGVGIDTYDIENNVTAEIVEPIMAQTLDSDKPSEEEIRDFDFVTTDSGMIVYVRNGVWFKDLKNNQDKQIAKDILDKSVLKTGYYSQVNASPELTKLIFRISWFEGASNEIYDLKSKTKSEFNDKSVIEKCPNTYWGSNVNQLLTWCEEGMYEPGLWATDLETKKTSKLYQDGIVSADISTNNEIAAISNAGIILISLNGENKLIKATDNNYIINNLKWGPEGKITYLLAKNSNNGNPENLIYDLHIMDKDGSNDQVIIEGITDYVWRRS